MPTPQVPLHHRPVHVVVDGSNLATEGRSAPSLKQLNEAVLAFMSEHPDAKITVVVDASFGHRIDKREIAEFDDAVNNNELVTPPAGAVGRGDAFVLAIANKVKATIISNDSYQEFHGEYPWLFDQGRLLGGKPVPHIGWVFVERSPVRGPTSKKATRTTRGEKSVGARVAKNASQEASGPMPIPKSPPPGARLAPRKPEKVTRAAPVEKTDSSSVNDVLAFFSFVEKHPVGSKLKGVVDSYSAHGAYVKVGEIKGYVPLRLLGSPAPRSAREAIAIGDSLALVVAGYTPSRRSVELGVPEAVMLDVKSAVIKKAGATKAVPVKKAAATKKTVSVKVAIPKKAVPEKKAAPEKKVTVEKVTAKKAVSIKKPAPVKSPAIKAGAVKVAAKLAKK